MHTLSVRQNPVICLYVKAISYSSEIGDIFQLARQMAPCLLILEDIDTLVTEQMRSYFFNEVDGLENNNGIMMIATTNHLDKLDGGLAKRPSRFDRKYAFPVPNRDERILYCDYWRRKLQYNKRVEFPEKLSPAIADITKDFTFAYLKEAFVASLLAIVRREEGDGDEHGEMMTSLEDVNSGFRSKPINDDKDISNLPLWIEIQKEVKLLREDMDTTHQGTKTRLFTGLPPSIRPPSMQRAEVIGDPPFMAEHETQDQVVRMRAAFNQKTTRIVPQPKKDSPMQTGGFRNNGVAELMRGSRN